MKHNNTFKLMPQGSTIRFPKPIFIAAIAALLTGFTAAPAWAAAGSGDPWMDFLYKSINAVMFFGLIYLVARKPVGAFFRGAAESSRNNYMDSRAEADRIAAELESQKKKLNDLEKELKWMVEEAKESAEDERKGLEAQAEAQAERIKAQSRQQMEQQIHQLRMELKEQLANDTIELAEKLIREKLDSKKQETLVKEFVDQVEAGR